MQAAMKRMRRASVDLLIGLSFLEVGGDGGQVREYFAALQSDNR